MKGGYQTLSKKETQAFLNQASNHVYKKKNHIFIPLRMVGRNYCRLCGLVLLKNKMTEWSVNKGCYHSDHPNYKRALKRLTKA